jgi:hypothetical protein
MSEIDLFLKLVKDPRMSEETSEEKLKRLLDETVALSTVREARVIHYHSAIVRAIELLETGRPMGAVKVLREAVKVKSV